MNNKGRIGVPGREVAGSKNKRIIEEINNRLGSLDSETLSVLTDAAAMAHDAEVAKEGAVYDVTARNNGTTFASLDALLSDANLSNLIPTGIRKGGMSIRFVQSSDNNYVQFRCTADDFTTDTDKWSYCDNSVYIDAPEWVEVVTDSNNKILYGVKADGNFYFGSSCPPQVVEYISNKLGTFDASDYADIKNFLGNLIEDNTLTSLLYTKVDKEEGKSLISSNVAEGIGYIENPEWIDVKTDSTDKVLEGTRVNGTKVIKTPLETQGDIQKAIDSPEWAEVLTDNSDKVIYGIRKDGTFCTNKQKVNDQTADFIKINNQLLLSTNANKKLKDDLIPPVVPPPMVTFIDDDGHINFKTYGLPIIQSKKVPVGATVIGMTVNDESKQNVMHWNDVLDCYNNGAEIISHSYSHYISTDIPNLSENEIQYDYQLMYNQLLAHGIYSPGCVYPGATDVQPKSITAVKAVHDYGIKGGRLEGINYKGSMDPYQIKRNTMTPGESNINTYKGMIDTIKNNGTGWLLFMIHFGDTSVFTPEEQASALSTLIDYCIDNDVLIVTSLNGYKNYKQIV